MADKGINIKDRNYELYVSLKSKKDKTDEEYFRILYTIIPHRHPLIITSKDIYDYLTKLLRQRKKAINFVKYEHNTYPSAEEWRTALMDILRGVKE